MAKTFHTDRDGPPPFPHWWWTDSGWRFWDGEDWSVVVDSSTGPVHAGNMAVIKTSVDVTSYTDYWPSNARVPRIDPAAAAGGGEG